MELSDIVAISLLLSFGQNVETFPQVCTSYKTIFVPQKSAAIFQSFSSKDSPVKFNKIHPTHQRLLKVRRSNQYNKDNLTVYDEHLLENRVNISVTRVSNNQSEIRIELKNVGMNDNGTYQLIVARERSCFNMFVMKIELEPNRALEEDEQVFIYADPPASLVKRPKANATMVWMLNGISVDHSAYFIKHDGCLWISKVKREFHGKTVTYRAIQDDGDEIDVSYLMNVSYGPSIPLSITPGITHYNLITGDSMPDIICSSECNPLCNISWGMYSAGRVLSLGTVTTDDSGEYTCTASRSDSRSVDYTISVLVSDDSSFAMDLVIGVVTIHAFVTFTLALCVFHMSRNRRYLFCSTDVNKTTENLTDATEVNGTNRTTLWL